MTVAQAIARSISHTEIVTLPASPERHEALIVECEDNVRNGTIHEFWGTTDDGAEWRVHLCHETAE